MHSCAAHWATLLFLACGVGANAQTDSPPPQTPPSSPSVPSGSDAAGVPAAEVSGKPAPVPDQPVQDKRILGVLPNYRTIDGTIPFERLTTEQKFIIATKDSFDWPGFILAGAFAGLYQLENSHPSFGQGVAGYAHRYATSYADQVIGNMLTEAIMPSLLREDPRYFRKINGSVKSRLFYSLTRVLIAKTDTGAPTFNFAEVLGNGVDGAIGNFYYPDERGLGDTLDRMGTAIATDAVSNVLKEFWPDIKRRYFKKRVLADEAKAAAQPH